MGIDKKEFVEIINQMMNTTDVLSEINDVIRKNRKLLGDFYDSMGSVVMFDDLVIELLGKLMNDEFDYIGYFIYELDYGRRYEPGMITTEDGEEIDISTAEKLYDYLAQ